MEYYYYETTHSSTTTTSSSINSVGNDEEVAAAERVIEKMAAESAVVIFSVSRCCMCYAIKRLLCGMGVNPTVHELDLLPHGHLLLSAAASSAAASLPLVFVGGKLLGAMDALMASHINGTLVPLLKDAGALWL